MGRGIAYKRFQRERHINRRENFLRKMRFDNPPHEFDDKEDMWVCITLPHNSFEGHCYSSYVTPNYNYRGILNKGKVQRPNGPYAKKTRNKNYRRRRAQPNINYKYSDLKKYQKMTNELSEWETATV